MVMCSTVVGIGERMVATHGMNVGDRVRHPTLTKWGIGQILHLVGSKVTVFFVEAGLKNISMDYVSLTVLDPPPSHPLLDRFDPAAARGPVYRSVNQSIEGFLDRYPGGFHGDRYLSEERDYKVKAHELATTNLARSESDGLLAAGMFAEVCRHAMQVVNQTNLIFPNEKMALRDGLKSAERKEAFATALHELLHGEQTYELRFYRFTSVLDRMGAAKWTVATYFPFLLYPSRHQFIKPKFTQNAARICAFEIKYSPRVRWETYQRILRFSDYLKSQLASLEPRDNIDVQSFMWAIAQG